jgi:hypothetical protein
VSSVVAYVVIRVYTSPLDAHACLSWWLVFSPVVYNAACLALECRNRVCTFQQLIEKIHIMQIRFHHLFSK